MKLIPIVVLTVVLYMSSAFIVAMWRRDNSIVDVAWGGGFVLISVLVAALTGLQSGRRILVIGFTLVWGVRLVLHIHARNRHRNGEDFRYRQWRETWGRWFVLRSFLQIFMLQGAVMLVIAAPILVVGLSGNRALGPMVVAGCVLWLIGFFFETVGDWQLLRFKRDPANQGAIMTTGLWRLTRHPNYFGEVVLWWGVFLVTLGAPHGWWALVSPVTITFLLLRVSGIPMLEKKYEGRSDFAHYRARTNAFFPWFPKRRGRVEGRAEP